MVISKFDRVSSNQLKLPREAGEIKKKDQPFVGVEGHLFELDVREAVVESGLQDFDQPASRKNRSGLKDQARAADVTKFLKLQNKLS